MLYQIIDYSGALKVGKNKLENINNATQTYKNEYKLIEEGLTLPADNNFFMNLGIGDGHINNTILVSTESGDVVFTQRRFISPKIKHCFSCGQKIR